MKLRSAELGVEGEAGAAVAGGVSWEFLVLGEGGCPWFWSQQPQGQPSRSPVSPRLRRQLSGVTHGGGYPPPPKSCSLGVLHPCSPTLHPPGSHSPPTLLFGVLQPPQNLASQGPTAPPLALWGAAAPPLPSQGYRSPLLGCPDPFLPPGGASSPPPLPLPLLPPQITSFSARS